MQRPAATRQRAVARLVAALLVQVASGVEVAQHSGKGYLRGASTGYVSERRLSSLAQVEQRTLGAQQLAIEALVAQEERLESDERRLEQRERSLSARLDQFSYLEQATGVLESTWRLAKETSLKDQLVGAGVYLLLVLLGTAIYGLFYMQAEFGELTRPPPEEALKAKVAFAFSILDGCSCDPDSRICMSSTFCTPVRWADTAASPKIQFVPNFWVGVAIYSLCVAFSSITYGLTSLLLLLVVTQNRMKIRQMYGLPDGLGARCEDCFFWLFCPTCATMQEAMEVEFIEPPRLQEGKIRKVSEGK